MQKSNAFPASPGRQKALTRWAIAAAVALNLVFVASALRNHRRQALSGPVGNVSVHPTEKPVAPHTTPNTNSANGNAVTTSVRTVTIPDPASNPYPSLIPAGASAIPPTGDEASTGDKRDKHGDEGKHGKHDMHGKEKDRDKHDEERGGDGD